MPTATLQTIYRATLDRLYPERYIRYGTATATSTTTLTDATQFLTSFSQTSHLVGAWIRISTVTTVEYALIASINATTGVITFDRTLTAAVTGALSYAITYERSPAHIDMVIDQVLRNTYTPRLFPLNSFYMLNDDWDMESTETITGMWSATNATQAKSTAAATLFPTGAQMLSVTATATPGFSALAANLPVSAGQQYWASVIESTTAGDSATFSIVNVDDSNATIEDATTDEVTFNELSFYFNPPTGCERINARLISDADTDITFWKDLSIIDTNQRIFPSPSWLIWPKQLLGGYEILQGSGGVHGNNDYRTFERRLRPFDLTVATSSPRSTQELLLESARFTGNRRYIYAMAPASALSLDTSTTFLDPDSVASSVVKVLKEQEPLERVLDEVRRTTLKSHHKIAREPAYAHFE